MIVIRRAAATVLVLCIAMAGLTSSTLAQLPNEQRIIEDPLFRVTSVIPADWGDQGGGTYARGTPPDDPALIAIQSASASLDQLWSALMPQLALTEIPESSGTYRTESYEWLLYPVTVELGDLAISVEVALVEDGDKTHLILLQGAPNEFEALREQVLLPAIDAFAPLAPEPTPDPSTLGYEVEEVSFAGGSDAVELAATLTLPSSPGPHPVVVLMSGSGPQDRDESLRPLTTMKPFALIADALTSAGVGVLRYDDRGVGGSTGDYAAATITELASDGSAAIDYLGTRDDVDQDRIGIVGHSEGCLYSAMLTPEDPRISFVVAMAPPAVDGVSLLVAQNEALMRSSGEPVEEIEHATAHAAEILPLARDGDVATAEAVAADYFGALWDRQSAEDRAVLGERESFIERQVQTNVDTYTSDWYRSLLAYDPGPDWSRVTVPVLGLFGAKDVQVVLEQNEPALRAALESAGNEDFETVVFPDANHLFQAADTGALQEYSELDPEFTPDFLPTIVDWVTARVGVGE